MTMSARISQCLLVASRNPPSCGKQAPVLYGLMHRIYPLSLRIPASSVSSRVAKPVSCPVPKTNRVADISSGTARLPASYNLPKGGNGLVHQHELMEEVGWVCMISIILLPLG